MVLAYLIVPLAGGPSAKTAESASLDDLLCEFWLRQSSASTVTGDIRPKETCGGAFATELNLLLLHCSDEISNVFIPSGVHKEVINIDNDD